MSSEEKVEFVQGEDVEIIVRLELINGDAFDLTSVTAIEARFKKVDKTVLSKTLGDGVEVVGSAPQNGKIKILLDDEETTSLAPSDAQDFEVKVTEGTKDKIIQFPKSLIIKRRLT